MAHRDNIIFGTDTKFGIDIAPATTNGSAAQFTLGYKRVEFVNMPLLVNGGDSKACSSASGSPCAAENLEAAKYLSRGGEAGLQADAYSVFASFGAEFGGGPNSTGGGLAQFFATGNAAQSLGSNTSIGRALSQQNSSTEALERANDVLTNALSANAHAAQAERGVAEAKRLEDRLETLIKLASPAGKFDKTQWDAMVDKMNGDGWSGYRSILKGYASPEEIRSDAPNESQGAVDYMFEVNVLNGE